MELQARSLASNEPRESSEKPALPARVRWIGQEPDWLHTAEARDALEGVELERSSADSINGRKLRVAGQPPDIVLLPRSDLRSLGAVREALPLAILVLDLSGDGEGHLGWRSVREAARADVILVGSLWELRELRRRYPSLAGRTILFRRPVDLAKFGSEPPASPTALAPFAQTAGQRILFAGPYTAAGGLDLILDAMNQLRERNARVRLAAIPSGRISSRYVARCKRRAGRLGNQALVASSVDPNDLPLWYRAADVVCLPCREPVGAEPARLAAAAGKPFLGTEVEPLLEHVVEGETGYLFPVDDFATFVAAVEALVGDAEEARRLGAAARGRAEQDLSPAVAARRLGWIWGDALSRGRVGATGARDANVP